MENKTAAADQFDWRWAFYAVLGAFLVLLPLTLYSSDIVEFLYLLVAAPCIGLFFLIAAFFRKRYTGRQRLAIAGMVLVYWAVSFLLVLGRDPLRTAGRWLLSAGEYKRSVLAQPEPVNGELKHAEWDAWGWGGIDTSVYLVFDPRDGLREEARSRAHGPFSGIPCNVARVQRLQPQWYTVQFYTDTSWSSCKESASLRMNP